MQKNNSWFLHVDLDAFFASVEQLDHPEYRGKPVIVGGKPEDKRSVVSTASYEARKYGVHSAMPIFKAVKLCPNGIYVHGRMERYAELSYQIMNIFKDYSPDVNQMSIDEAFIDLTGTEQLFGPPEETAMKIKQHVKQETGLTVSVGLATNKYLAKIASGMAKPDGFYFIHPGDEEKFMLNLPLNKVWGVGNKTQEALRNSGIRTTRDIYEKPLDVLQFLYGNAMGQFLYEAVRGHDLGSFGKEAKKHSISSETTFAEDVTDIFTLETKILELCHGINFRLLKEKCYSKTVFIKIRYGDFTTVSIQKTVDYNILTLDRFYSLAKEIFHEKYDHKSGIRLIGVGLDNVEKNPQSEQLYLFDDGTEKKQTVEKAILNLEQKHPEIKVHKARLLSSSMNKMKVLFISALLLFTLSGKTSVAAQSSKSTESKGASALLPDSLDTSTQGTSSLTETEEIILQEEQEAEEKQEKNILKNLFDWDLSNAPLEYSLSGYWALEFTENINFSFGKGYSFTGSFGAPIFKQEIDLSAVIDITKHWYFNLEFLDKFSKNTYTFGYKGDGNLKDFMFSNRNIIFPDYSSSDTGYALGGGENQAPGFIFHFEDSKKEKWAADLMLRFDITEFQDAVFYGKNKVNDFNLSLNSYLKGKIFVIPDETILQDIKAVYVESKNGMYTDLYGKKYSRLSESDYLISSTKNLLILSSHAAGIKKTEEAPSILITFRNEGNTALLIEKLGSYENETTYLGNIQAYFNTSPYSKINLKEYTFPLQNKIENEAAIQIQNSTGFSPFLYAALYDCGIITEGSADIVSRYSEQVSEEYFAEVSSLDFDFAREDFFFENHLYAETGKTSEKNKSYLEAAQRYPFADKNPFVYLNDSYEAELSLRLRTFSAITNFDIGKKASGGTVRVYINGILDNSARYEATSGFVYLSQNVKETDKVYITWQEESDDINNAALSFGAGYLYHFNENLTGDLAFTTTWPLSKYSSNFSGASTGFSALTGGLNYKTQDFEVKDSLSLAIFSQNISGLYVANAQLQEIPETYYLSQSNGYKTNNTPVLNTSSAPILNSENNGTVLSFTGTSDKEITGYKIPLEWDFTELDKNDFPWASVDVKLAGGTNLINSSELEIALKPETEISNLQIFVQLGVKAEKDFSGESGELIPTWEITKANNRITNIFNPENKEWQIIKLHLSDSDRAKLLSAWDLRLIVVGDAASSEKGIISIGPYEPHIQSCFTYQHNSILVNSTVSSAIDSPSAKKTFKADTNATEINWNITDKTLSTDQYQITAVNYFEYSDFASYKTINFDFSLLELHSTSSFNAEETGLTFILDSGASSPLEEGKIALKIELSSECLEALISNTPKWHKLTVNTVDKAVYIDEIQLSHDLYTLKINKSVMPSRQKVIVNAALPTKLVEKGSLLLGNLYYEETGIDFTAKNYVSAAYKKDSLGAVKNLNIELTSLQTSSINSSNFNKNNLSIDGNLETGFSLMNLDFSGGISAGASSNSNQFFREAEHSVKSATTLFQFFNFAEDYTYNKTENELSKHNNFTLNFAKLHVPLTLNFDSTAQALGTSLSQNAKADINLKFNIKEWNFTFGLDSAFVQKIPHNDITNGNYFSDYGKAFLLEFSTGNPDSTQRSENLTAQMGIKTPFAGLSPELKYVLTGNYKESNTSNFKDAVSFKFSLPFEINKNTLSFNINKSAGSLHETSQDGSYISDMNFIFNNQNNKNWFYSSLPFADLFSRDLPGKIFESSAINSWYSSMYELTWERPLANSTLDFYLPVNSSFSFSRDISKADSISDFYQLKLTAGNTFVNMLGSKGRLHWFKFFSQDEFNSYLTAILKIPSNNTEDIKLMISWYGSLLMYIDSKNTIRTGLDFNIQDSINWQLRTTGIWSHSGTKSFITYIPKLFIKDFSDLDSSLIRKETFNISLGCADSKNTESVELIHAVEMKLLSKYTITASFGMNLIFTEKAATILGTTAAIGGKLSF